MKRLGVDVGGTFTDLIYVDDEAGRILVHKLPTTPADPSQGTVQGLREVADQAETAPSELDQVFHGTTIATNIVIEHTGARVGHAHHRGLPGHPPHRAAQEAAQLLELPGSAVAALPDRAAARPADGARADRQGRLRARAAGRGAGSRAGAGAQGGRRRGGGGLLPLLVRQPRARGARGRDRPRGVPRGIPLGLVGGAAAVPRVRALLDRVPERVRRPEGGRLRVEAPRGAGASRRADALPPDDVGQRRRDSGRRRRASGEPPHVRAGGGRRRAASGPADRRATTTSSPSTWAGRRPTSAWRRKAACA